MRRVRLASEQRASLDWMGNCGRASRYTIEGYQNPKLVTEGGNYDAQSPDRYQRRQGRRGRRAQRTTAGDEARATSARRAGAGFACMSRVASSWRSSGLALRGPHSGRGRARPPVSGATTIFDARRLVVPNRPAHARFFSS